MITAVLALLHAGLAQAKRQPIKAIPTKPAALSSQAIYERFHDSVVQIETDKKTGSGFFIRDGRTIITAFHVIEDATNITIKGSKGESWVISSCTLNPDNDVAVLSVSTPTGRNPIHLADFESLKPGQEVTVIGSPNGLTDSVSNGIISARRIDKETELVQFSAAISPGSSGGPVIDTEGEAVGLVDWTLTSGQSLNFAVAGPAVHRTLDTGKPVPVGDLFAESAKADAQQAAQAAADKAKEEAREEQIKQQRSELQGLLDKANSQLADLKQQLKGCTDDAASEQDKMQSAYNQDQADRSTLADDINAVQNATDAVRQAQAEYNSEYANGQQIASNDRQGYATAAAALSLSICAADLAKKRRALNQAIQRENEQTAQVGNDNTSLAEIGQEIELLRTKIESVEASIVTAQSDADAITAKLAALPPEPATPPATNQSEKPPAPKTPQ